MFKDYKQGQLNMFPLDIEELVPSGHVARVINSFIDNLDTKIIYNSFSHDGCPAYHPVMMLKVLIYAYSTKVFSSRDIEKSLKQDVVFMWLSGMQTPDHNTVNRFRGKYLSEVLDEVFFQVVWMLKENGYISLNDLFVDGTKMEANAGKHTYIWRKNVERYKAGVKDKICLLLQDIEKINKEEDKQYEGATSSELTIGENIDDTQLKDAAQQANEELKKKMSLTEDKKELRALRKQNRKLTEQIEKLEKYQEQEKLLDGRNSYSKTDTDATFMRDKSDLLRACYNPIISTNDQFIVNVTLSQTTADNVGFKEHVQKLLDWNGGCLIPQNYIGDAGFGNEENFSYLEEKEIGNYLKFNTFHYESTEKFKKKVFHPDNMQYNAVTDTYTCPAGKKINMTGYEERTTATGYQVKAKVYECEDCSGCTLKDECKNNQGNRRFTKSEKLEYFKEQARNNLNSDEGIQLRRKRGPDVETPFADIKFNMGKRKFSLRGKEKVTMEMLWLSLAHNMKKVARKTA